MPSGCQAQDFSNDPVHLTQVNRGFDYGQAYYASDLK